jgi:hypothetical protein
LVIDEQNEAHDTKVLLAVGAYDVLAAGTTEEALDVLESQSSLDVCERPSPRLDKFGLESHPTGACF